MGNLYPERVLAFAFLTVGYMSPSPESDISLSFGRELYGYWLFFSEDGADKVIENHVCPFPCSCVHLGMNEEQVSGIHFSAFFGLTILKPGKRICAQ
jgi:hypothetical protein